MAKRLITDTEVAGKKVILRVDFNVPHQGEIVSDDKRVRAALPTIEYLLKHHAKVILMSHLGKVNHKDPEQTEKDKKKNDMAILMPILQRLLPHRNIIYVPETRGQELEEKIHSLQAGEMLLMQNTRYEKAETKNDPELASYWASLGDLFVSDAFGSVHRAHASTVGIANHLPSAVGYLIQKELVNLEKALTNIQRPFVAILGGAKVSDKIGVIENLLTKADKVIIGGAMAYTFYRAKGYSVGDSLVEEDKVAIAKDFLAKANGKLILPIDTVVAEEFDNPKDIRRVKASAIPDGFMGMDIGEESIDLFTKELSGAKTVFWNGPMGVFEKKEFAKGTSCICEAIANLPDCLSIIGGGDSASAAKLLGYEEKFSHISTGGGASLEYMEGKELPGIAVIEEK